MKKCRLDLIRQLQFPDQLVQGILAGSGSSLYLQIQNNWFKDCKLVKFVRQFERYKYLKGIEMIFFYNKINQRKQRFNIFFNKQKYGRIRDTATGIKLFFSKNIIFVSPTLLFRNSVILYFLIHFCSPFLFLLLIIFPPKKYTPVPWALLNWNTDYLKTYIYAL